MAISCGTPVLIFQILSLLGQRYNEGSQGLDVWGEVLPPVGND